MELAALETQTHASSSQLSSTHKYILCNFIHFRFIHKLFQVGKAIFQIQLTIYSHLKQIFQIQLFSRVFKNKEQKAIIVHAFVESNCWFMQKRKEIQFRRLHSRVYFVTGLASVENNIYFRFWPLWEFYNTTFVSFFLLILGFRHLQPLQKLYLTFHHIYLFLFCFIK